MKIFNVLSKSLLLGASFLNNFQYGQAKAQEIDPPKASRDILEEAYYKSIFSIKEQRVEQLIPEKSNSTWRITYTLKYNGKEELILYPFNITMEYAGENLSNSRHKSHSLPRTTDPKQVPYKVEKTITFPMPTLDPLCTFPASIKVPETRYRLSYAEPTKPIKLKLNETEHATVIPSFRDKDRCREKIKLTAREFDIYKSGGTEDRSTSPVYKDLGALEPLKLRPGGTFQLIIEDEHEHFLEGKYDPLLGDRNITVNLGKNKIFSNLSLNHEVNPAKVIPELSKIDDHRIFDTNDYKKTEREKIADREGQFLYIAAHESGFQYYRFDDMHIKAGDKFKLSFDYCIGIGTEGNCHVRVMEYQDTPNAWYRLEGGFDAILGYNDNKLHLNFEESIDVNKTENEKIRAELLNIHKEEKSKMCQRLQGEKYKPVFKKACTEIPKYAGRWQRFECELDTRSDTTTFALDFRIVGANAGEMWIDNLNLENLSVEKESTRRLYPSTSFYHPESISQITALAK